MVYKIQKIFEQNSQKFSPHLIREKSACEPLLTNYFFLLTLTP